MMFLCYVYCHSTANSAPFGGNRDRAKYSTDREDGQSWAGAPPDHSSPGERLGATTCDGSTMARSGSCDSPTRTGSPSPDVSRTSGPPSTSWHSAAATLGIPGVVTVPEAMTMLLRDILARNSGRWPLRQAPGPIGISPNSYPAVFFQGKTRRGSCFLGTLHKF